MTGFGTGFVALAMVSRSYRGVASGNVLRRGLLRSAAIPEAPMAMPAPLPVQEVVADHRALGLTLGAHPLTFLRQRLHKQRFMPAEVLAHYAHGQLARGCGIFTVRQRPETAKSVVFVTLEDETGNVYVIMWTSLVEQQRFALPLPVEQSLHRRVCVEDLPIMVQRPDRR